MKGIRKYVLDLEPCVHGARVAESAEIAKKRIEEMIDFSSNLNPVFPPKLEESFVDAYKAIKNYPDNRYHNFRKIIADYLNVMPENIVPGNGSSELIRLFAEVVIEAGDRVIIPHPTYAEYEFQCKLLGGEIEYVYNISNIKLNGCKAIFICNPNNPTGSLIKREELLKLAEECEHNNAFLFVDEAFIELSSPEESMVDFAVEHDHVVVLRSLTKSFAIPGLRIGYVVASSNFANILNRVRLPWNLNSVAEVVVRRLLDKEYLKSSREMIRKEREWLISRLRAIHGFKPYHSKANFILVDVNQFFMSSKELADNMLKHGIIIRECSSFGLENHIRVGVKKREENIILIKTFEKVISEWGSKLAEKEIRKALELGTIRSRRSCEYYPCHFEGQDCTFCFCPFYPCKDTRTGGEFVYRATGGKVWSCAKCVLIHESETADKVLKALMKGKKLREVWEMVIDPKL